MKEYFSILHQPLYLHRPIPGIIRDQMGETYTSKHAHPHPHTHTLKSNTFNRHTFSSGNTNDDPKAFYIQAHLFVWLSTFTTKQNVV